MNLVKIGTSTAVRSRKLEHDLIDALEGDVRFGQGDRALYATDASNYRHVPIGVIAPRDERDVMAALEVCRAHGVPVLGRGGGTSLAGQCCNEAVVFDFTKYMREIVEVDPERRTARVQPGVVLDDLRAVTREHGLTFGPDPATHDRCTLGGMIGNNSCGIHSVQSEFYGPGPRVEDNIRSLDIVTYDGLRMRVGPTSDAQYEAILAEGGRKAQIYRDLRALRDHHADLIRARFPNIPRRVSGYSLPALLPENSFDVARALVGTEGTCAMVLEAQVLLSPLMPERVLVVLGYPSVYEAGDDVVTIRRHRPVGCEGMDDRLVEFMLRKKFREREIALLPPGRGWLLVEFGADTLPEALEQARALKSELEARTDPPSIAVFEDPQLQHKLWDVRESGLAGTAFVPGEPDAWPGWEDAAVPPERVGQYLRDFDALLRRYDLRPSLYGHFAQGCIHTRIGFDLQSAQGVDAFRNFTREAADLVVHHKGALSGEHGDGQARGDLLERMFGHELVSAFRRFKAIWDPRGKMNPGKVVDAQPRTANIRPLGYPAWEPQTNFDYTAEQGRYSRAALRCVGVGKCRKTNAGTMCPSYMATLEEKHSTRGRAHLLFEMMHEDALVEPWTSDAVHESLDLCLACKACKTECPVNVDMADYKAEFMAHYYEHRLRPRTALSFGRIRRWAELASKVPRLVNLLGRTPVASWLAKKAAGMAPQRDFPQFAPRTFTQWFAEHADEFRGSRYRVMLWPDTFSNAFLPGTLVAAAEVLRDAGCEVVIPHRPLCCGRPLYDFGLLDEARAQWEEVLESLQGEIEAGTPIVGVEPSCVAAFRDELGRLFPDDPRARALGQHTYLLSEFLVDGVDDYHPPMLDRQALVFMHCHHRSVMGLDAETRLLERSGLDFDILDAGCCGMAGAFGFEAHKYDVSVAVGERALLPRVREASPATLIVANGFSCREQIRQLTDRQAVHVGEVLQMALHQHELVPSPHAEDERRLLWPPDLTGSPKPA
jgi:FAD/FMN-containing dehydrogenase/Fe-S oxidoreductase